MLLASALRAVALGGTTVEVNAVTNEGAALDALSVAGGGPERGSASASESCGRLESISGGQSLAPHDLALGTRLWSGLMAPTPLEVQFHDRRVRERCGPRESFGARRLQAWRNKQCRAGGAAQPSIAITLFVYARRLRDPSCKVRRWLEVGSADVQPSS